MAADVVRVTGLTKRFGPVRAVDGLDVTVAAGEVVGLLGPNGAGKTTTIRTLMGYLRPDAGTVTVLGGISSDPSVRRRIGYLPGEAAFDRRMTVERLLDWYGALRGGVSADSVRTLAHRLDLDLDRRIGELSTGNRRKVGVVQALMHEPDVLILDEASVGLDPLNQREVVHLVRERAAAGVAVLYSSHVLSEVEDVADRVVMLNTGRVVHASDVSSIRSGAHQRLEFRLAATPPHDVLADVPGIGAVTVADNRVTVDVTGKVDELMRRLAPLGIEHLVAHTQDLEDLFFEYYRGPGAASDAQEAAQA